MPVSLQWLRIHWALVALVCVSYPQESTSRSLLQAPAKNPALLKRGIGYSFHFIGINDIQTLTALRDLGWWYTWSPRPTSQAAVQLATDHGIEFVPMLWHMRTRRVMNITTPAKYLLGYNEPNVRSQGNTSPEEAALAYQNYREIAGQNVLSSVSHAAAPCWGEDNSTDCISRSPFDWWDQFYSKCGEIGANCDSDYIATHLYTCDPTALAAYINEVWQRYQKSIWLTEFACCMALSKLTHEENEAKQITYLRTAMAYLDSDPRVFRYAWFGPRVGQYPCVGPSADLMNYDGTLTTLGKVYGGQPIDPSTLPPVIAQAVFAPVPQITVVGWAALCQPYDNSAATRATEAALRVDPAAHAQFMQKLQSCGYQDMFDSGPGGPSIEAAKSLAMSEDEGWLGDT